MRKLSLLLLLLLGFLLLSCSMTPSSVIPGAAEDGITLKTQFPVYAPDVPFIQFTIENNSGDTAEFGTPWMIERLEGDTWYTVPFAPDTTWNMPLIMLADGGTASGTAYLSMLDHKLKNGTYRIVKEINDTFYTAEFSVGDSPVGKDSPYGYLPLATLSDSYTAEQAVADGVVLLSPDADLTRFFREKEYGMGSQLRYGVQKEDGTLFLADLTVEVGYRSNRIRYEDSTGEILYRAYIITDGEQIALSAFSEWQDDDASRFLLDDLRGNASVLRTLQEFEDARNERVAYFIERDPQVSFIRPAAFWSDDGTKVISLYRDESAPLEFGISEYYADGGSAGHTVVLDTPGMKALRSAMWSGETTVMLICDVENTLPDMAEMTGYVFYDTAEDQVLSYTQSWYEPVRQTDGSILIPE